MGKKLLVTSGPSGRPFQPELEEATVHLTGHNGLVMKVRTFRSKDGQTIKREFWAVSPISSHLAKQHDRAPGSGKSHAARTRKVNGKTKTGGG